MVCFMAGGHAKQPSPLVEAAAALEGELREYDELAREAERIRIDGERGLRRAAAIVNESGGVSERIQERLRALVGEIEGARLRQVESLKVLLEAATTVEKRAQQHRVLMERFAALGEAAGHVNTLTLALSEKRSAGASDTELLHDLQGIQTHIALVLAEAETLSHCAREEQWPDLARQADSVRQQVSSAKNKLAMAHKAVAMRAPS
jgi:hypothetical protein